MLNILKMLSVVWLASLLAVAVAGLQKNFINFGGFVCPREEHALGRCLKDSLNAYIPQLATGLPEYGVPPCEPLVVPAMVVEQSTGAIKVKSTYTDVIVTGPSRMKVKTIEVDSKEHRVVAKLYIPQLKMKGRYQLDGVMLMLPIEGEGTFSGTYDGIDAVVTIKLGREPRKDEPDALSCLKLDVKFQIQKASVQLDNLFGGDDDLGAAMNRFLNEHWRELAEELQAPMETALRDFLKPLADHAFATLNADDILI